MQKRRTVALRKHLKSSLGAGLWPGNRLGAYDMVFVCTNFTRIMCTLYRNSLFWFHCDVFANGTCNGPKVVKGCLASTVISVRVLVCEKPAISPSSFSTDPLVGWGGRYSLPFYTPLTPSASRFRWRLSLDASFLAPRTKSCWRCHWGRGRRWHHTRYERCAGADPAF